MQPIIDRIDPELIKKELTAEKFLRRTNKGGNEIYVIDAFDSPNTMLEVGRLREISFRDSGGGTGKECDIDEFDTMEPPCRQMIVWSPEDEQIIGGYRFILGSDIKVEQGVPRIATSHLFDFSEKFLEEILPHTIELGRSFVVPVYQGTGRIPKTIYALDNLWDGLGAITVLNPDIKWLFGKVTMYPGYDRGSRDMILGFMHRWFPDPDGLMTPRQPLDTAAATPEIQDRYTGDYKEDYRILTQYVRSAGEKIPPLVNAYMSLSPTMRSFGTAINTEFGDVEETGILINVDEVYEEKKARHIHTFRNPNEK